MPSPFQTLNKGGQINNIEICPPVLRVRTYVGRAGATLFLILLYPHDYSGGTCAKNDSFSYIFSIYNPCNPSWLVVAGITGLVPGKKNGYS